MLWNQPCATAETQGGLLNSDIVGSVTTSGVESTNLPRRPSLGEEAMPGATCMFT